MAGKKATKSGTDRKPKSSIGTSPKPTPKQKKQGSQAARRKATAPRLVYDFSQGNKEMKFLLGGKGANLAEMTNLGLPVPPGFVITTDACREYMRTGKVPPGLQEQVEKRLRALERAMGRSLGDAANPLLVAVRSGSMFSMPGMMDTVLNLGMNDESVKGLASQTGDDRYAWDCYRRFIQMFGKTVTGIPGDDFEQALTQAKGRKAKSLRRSPDSVADTDLESDDMREMVARFKEIYKTHTRRSFPQDPRRQLSMSIEAVFNSWNNKRAQDYRRLEGIDDSLGTAVNVMAMVFGNKGDDSGTGVAFTRDPASGKPGAYGDYLVNAQGEDVVAGIRTPEPLQTLRKLNRKAYDELLKIMERLERHYRDMCDVEFTVEQKKLWMLQTRIGKRTPKAAVRVAVEMANERLITRKEAVRRVSPSQLDQLLHPQFDPDADVKVLARGVNASPGAAVGKVVLDADTAVEWVKRGEKVILVRDETNPDDVHGMYAAEGILTARGGKTSHAAVVARGAGKPCVVGADEVRIELGSRSLEAGGTTVREGDVISIDGTQGTVVLGSVALVAPSVTGEFATLLSWADTFRKLGVRANADTPEDAQRAREFGAAGIGLARTEHMFLGDRLPIVRRAILATGDEERDAALEALLEMQRTDFEGIFRAMDGLPVTVRLLDPPLHEFLPGSKEMAVEIERLRIAGEISQLESLQQEVTERTKLLRLIEQMEESNPMLGLRGCRLGLVIPGIYRMQVRAIMEAACKLAAAGGKPGVEIMIPLVGIESEIRTLRAEADAVAKQVIKATGTRVAYRIGTMIEVPRAALVAREIARHADFFSFGTNDLTQMTYAFSRDDMEGKFLSPYLERQILDDNPFETLDVAGVGRLVEMATRDGRSESPKLKVGVCGEHGGDPQSVAFFHDIGLDYVSCSPFRVPIARLAAAHSAIGPAESAST
ncbi:MAG TPA: pyruvate, phosphate dikinase [Actinomycetota bacterium]|nr:pyruvate, phosphate dikinase [Actinomycetota bacterium]